MYWWWYDGFGHNNQSYPLNDYRCGLRVYNYQGIKMTRYIIDKEIELAETKRKELAGKQTAYIQELQRQIVNLEAENASLKIELTHLRGKDVDVHRLEKENAHLYQENGSLTSEIGRIKKSRDKLALLCGINIGNPWNIKPTKQFVENANLESWIKWSEGLKEKRK